MSRLPSSAFSPQLSDGSVLPRSPAPHAPRGRGLRARLRSLQPGVTAAVTADSSGRFPADPKHSNFRSFWGAALAPLRGGTPATTPFILSDKSPQAGRRNAPQLPQGTARSARCPPRPPCFSAPPGPRGPPEAPSDSVTVTPRSSTPALLARCSRYPPPTAAREPASPPSCFSPAVFYSFAAPLLTVGSIAVPRQPLR